MKFKELLNETKKPSKVDINLLIKSFAMYMLANEQNAPIKIQQRFYDKYMDTLDRISKKYSGFDTSSSRFQQQLTDLARKFLDKKVMKGSGVDW